MIYHKRSTVDLQLGKFNKVWCVHLIRGYWVLKSSLGGFFPTALSLLSPGVRPDQDPTDDDHR